MRDVQSEWCKWNIISYKGRNASVKVSTLNFPRFVRCSDIFETLQYEDTEINLGVFSISRKLYLEDIRMTDPTRLAGSWPASSPHWHRV